MANEPDKIQQGKPPDLAAWGVVVILTEHSKASVTLDARSAGGKVIGPMAYYRIPTD